MIRYRIGDRVHDTKNKIRINPDNLKCFILYAKNDLSSVSISKRHNRFYIFFAMLRNLHFIFDIFRFSAQQWIFLHHDHLISYFHSSSVHISS